MIIKCWSSERKTEYTMSLSHFNEERDYSEEKAFEDEVFPSTSP